MREGVFNILEHRLGKEVADAGDLMLVFSSPSLSQHDRVHRCACIVAGIRYSPMWEASCLCFGDPEQVLNLAFQLPRGVRLASRESLPTGQKTTVDLTWPRRRSSLLTTRPPLATAPCFGTGFSAQRSRVTSKGAHPDPPDTLVGRTLT